MITKSSANGFAALAEQLARFREAEIAGKYGKPSEQANPANIARLKKIAANARAKG